MKVLAPPIECELYISIETFLNNYDIIKRKPKMPRLYSTIRKRAKKDQKQYSGDFFINKFLSKDFSVLCSDQIEAWAWSGTWARGIPGGAARMIPGTALATMILNSFLFSWPVWSILLKNNKPIIHRLWQQAAHDRKAIQSFQPVHQDC